MHLGELRIVVRFHIAIENTKHYHHAMQRRVHAKHTRIIRVPSSFSNSLSQTINIIKL